MYLTVSLISVFSGEDLVPGPDGQLISTEQREQIIREQQDGKYAMARRYAPHVSVQV